MTDPAVQQHPLSMFSGWAYPRKLLQPLADELSDVAQVELYNAGDPLPAAGAPRIVVGWSLGAMRALAAATKDSRPFTRLVLLAGTARFNSAQSYPCGFKAELLRNMQRLLPDREDDVLAAFYELSAHPHEPEPVDASAISRGDLEQGLRIIAAHDVRSSVAYCKCPVLLLHGAEDRIVPAAAARWLATALPQAHLEILSGEGHDFPIRHPEWVAEEIRNFLRATS